MAEGLPRYGVIKWIGSLPSLKGKLVVGLELVRTVSDVLFFSQMLLQDPYKGHLSIVDNTYLF